MNPVSTSGVLITFAIAGAACWLLTGLVLRYALRRSIIDVPNERSLHTEPVPRGGGLAIGAVVLAGLAVLAVAHLIPGAWAIGLGGGGILVAGIGWMDDRGSVAPSRRALVHVIAAGWAVYWLGGMPGLLINTTRLSLGLGGSIFAVVSIMWSINAYNFMDGIDGIAGAQGLVAGGIGTALLIAGARADLAVLTVIPVGACAGFLLWNWQPARIFMGDVGSGLLGFLFASFAMLSERMGAVPAVVWLLLFGVFFFDATVTLVRRAVHRQRWYEAHRTHAYQRVVRRGLTHGGVVLGVTAMNCALGLLAGMMILKPSLTWIGLLGGVLLLGVVYAAVERRFPMRSDAARD
ncbi:MAG: glycosyltransferase family 4 protein [Gemmatimonadota bacterium]